MEKRIINPFDFKEHQNSNGLFSASVSSKNKIMKNFWLRDNYYVWLAVDQEIKQGIKTGFQKIFDNNIEKITLHGKVKPKKEYEYIHPVYNKNLQELKQEWGWLQNDSTGNFLEVLAESDDKERSELIVDYLETIEYYTCKDRGFWEEGPKELRVSSLAACIRGLERFQKNIKNNEKIENLISKGYKAMYNILPNETLTRKHDLALLSLIYPTKLITDPIKHQIITNVQSLEGHWGVKRYHGDTWSGNEETRLTEENRMQWTMGLPWLYLCTGETEYILRATESYKKQGIAYEGIINGNSNNTHLIWAEAMFKLATDKFKSKK